MPENYPQPKKRKWWLLILIAAAAVGVIVVFTVVLPAMEKSRKTSQYNHAQELMDDEQYLLAWEQFVALEDFQDAPAKAAECQQLQKQVDDYAAAKQEYDKKNWAAAKKKFDALKDYKDSKTLSKDCQNHIDYNDAVSKLDAGEYEEALEIFTKLGNFEESKTKADECQKMITLIADYDNAQSLFTSGKYKEARQAFTDLGDYEDSAEMADKCGMLVDYLAAVQIFNEGHFTEAKEAFEKVRKDWPEADDWLSELSREPIDNKTAICDTNIAYDKAMALFDKGDLAGAKKGFDAIKEKVGLSDARKQNMSAAYKYMDAMDLFNNGSFYDAYLLFNQLGIKDSDEMAKKCIQPTPGTGETYRNPNFAGANCSLAIYPPTDDGNSNYLKLYTTDEQLVSCIFIQSGGSGYLELPGGLYIIKCAYGSGPWFGETDMFGDEGNYYIMELEDGNYVVNIEAGYDWELTLRTSSTEGQPMGEEKVPRQGF